MKKSEWACHDVMWFSNRFKKPIAYSTKADSDCLSIINQPNMTAFELMAVLNSGEYLVSPDMKKVVQAFIDRGCGEEVLLTTSP